MPDGFWEMDEVEAALWIRGYQRRFEQLDDLLASVKATLIAPRMKNGKKPNRKGYRTIARNTHDRAQAGRDSGSNMVSMEERQERFDRVRRDLDAEAIPVDLRRMRHHVCCRTPGRGRACPRARVGVLRAAS